MPEHTDHQIGTVSWVDIGTDVQAAKGFYSGLFGWEGHEAGPPEETGGYGFFLSGGRLVGGYGPQNNPGPPYWTVYFASADADETAARVEKAGGKVAFGPTDVMDQGRMAVFQDPEGAFFAVWQAGAHHGVQLTGEPGSMGWVELNSRDPERARSFYPEVFGWDMEVHQGEQPYTEFKVGGTSMAGLMAMPDMVPKEVPPYWLVYFGTSDVDGASDQVRELGGAVLAGPMDFPGGRFAVVQDPQGAVFGLLRMAS